MGTSYDYLFTLWNSQKVEPGQSVNDLAQGFLKKSKRQTTGLIKKLVRKAETIKPELAGLALSGRLYMDAEKYKAVAEALEKEHPGFRKLYGGLYSVLGHIQKACRDNPAFQVSDAHALQLGTRYYQIANDIRGYRVST